MPFLLVELGEAGYALIGGLLAIGVTFLIRAIGNSLPSINVSFVHIHFGSLFDDAVDGVVGWIVDATKDTWSWLANWFDGHAYLITQLAQSVANVAYHLGNQIAHIVTVEIPNAANDVRGFAVGKVEELANTVETDTRKVAIDAANALGAADRAVYHALARELPTIEHDIKSAVASAVDSAEDFTTGGLNDLKKWTEAGLAAVAAKALHDLEDVKKQLGTAIGNLTQTVADDLRTAEGYTNTLVGQAERAAEAEFDTAEKFTTSKVGEAEKAAQGLFTQAEAFTTSEVGKAEAAAKGLFTEAETFTTTKVGEAEKAASSALGSAVGTLTGEIGQAETAASTALGQAVGTLGGEITGAAQGAEATLEGALEGVYTDITGKSIAAGGDLAGIEGLLAGAITTSIAGVATRVAHLEECSVTSCDGPNNLSNLLQGLIGVADFAAFAAFIAGAINSPGAAVRSFTGEADQLYRDADSLMNTLLSI